MRIWLFACLISLGVTGLLLSLKDAVDLTEQVKRLIKVLLFVNTICTLYMLYVELDIRAANAMYGITFPAVYLGLAAVGIVILAWRCMESNRKESDAGETDV